MESYQLEEVLQSKGSSVYQEFKLKMKDFIFVKQKTI